MLNWPLRLCRVVSAGWPDLQDQWPRPLEEDLPAAHQAVYAVQREAVDLTAGLTYPCAYAMSPAACCGMQPVLLAAHACAASLRCRRLEKDPL
jgi:hypothetical protein